MSLMFFIFSDITTTNTVCVLSGFKVIHQPKVCEIERKQISPLKGDLQRS